jgi:hypothetical protein
MQHRLEKIHVDNLTNSGMDSNHRGESSHDRRDFISEGNRRENRFPIGLSLYVGESRHRFSDRREPWTMTVGTGLTKARHASDDKSWIRYVQNFGIEPECFELAWPEILDENIGSIEKAPQDRQAFLGFQIKNDCSLPTTSDFPKQRDVIGWVAPTHRTNSVASTGSLNLDDIGTEIGEMSSTSRASKHRRNVDNTKIRKWSGH